MRAGSSNAPIRTIKTPQLLELSGIGNPQILNGLGIDTKVDLPGVGEGIIDQVFFGVSYGEYLISLCVNHR